MPTKSSDTAWLTMRAILATANSKLKSLNDEIIDRFPGLPSTFISGYSVVLESPKDQKAMELRYPLFNSIDSGSSFPDYLCTENGENKTKNVVYPEVLSNTRNSVPNLGLIENVHRISFPSQK